MIAWVTRHLLRLAYLALSLQRRLFEPVTLGVRILLVRDGEVLLVRHSYREGWFLPGGGVKRRETLEQAVRREAREEVWAEIQDLRLVGLFSNFIEAKSDHIAVFASEQFTLGPDCKSDEIAEARFFPLDALPPEVSPGSERRIAEYRDGAGLAANRW